MARLRTESALITHAILNVLRERLRSLARPVAGDLVPLIAAGTSIGALSSDFAARVIRSGEGLLTWSNRGLQLNDALQSETLTSVWAALAGELREEGWFGAWRDEAYDVRVGEADESAPVLCQLERGAFRRFGLRSRAVHVNGVTADGRMWIARRSMHKAIDPGMLDNIVGGGIASGENAATTLIRECAEEAGIAHEVARLAVPSEVLHARRLEDEGVHDEILHVFKLTLPDGFVPRNTDGEVADFGLLEAKEVAARIVAGDFTQDAAAVASAWLLAKR